MRTQLLFVATLVLLTFTTVIGFASLYGWNESRRPPIALADALSRAEKLLGNDAANRYCVRVSLFGDENGEGKKGAWNFFFAAADGSKKLVHIDMQGKGDVQVWNGPIDWKKNDGRRTDLADVHRRLAELFRKEGIRAEFESNKDRLLAKFNIREFQIYPQQDDGSYAEQVQRAQGPTADGIWLQVQIVDKPDPRAYGYDDGPYWSWHRGTYFLTESGKFLAIDMRYGAKVKYEVIQQITQIFGERTLRL